jgi:VanZ family protein
VSGGSPLVRLLFAVDVLLTAYATLYPLEGWRVHGLSPLAYLGMGWPRHFIAFDVAANVLGYAPYGFLCVAALHPRWRGLGALAVALLTAAALSLTLEAAQSYLPARTPSTLDVLCNIAGAAMGALAGLRLAPWLLGTGPLQRLRAAVFLPGAEVDLGLVLLALWLLIQLNPATLLFGAGDLRDLVGPQEGRGRAPEFFVLIEALVTSANLVTVSLMLSALTTPGKPIRIMFLMLVCIALVVRAAAYVVLMRAELLLAWLTQGAQLGLLAGIAAAAAAVALPRTARLVLAAVLLLAATVLVNLAPPNPYLAASLKVWRQGHFLNFNGLTRLVAAAWPFLALGYLMFLAARRGREPQG